MKKNKKIQTTRRYLRNKFLNVIFATFGFVILPAVLLVIVQDISIKNDDVIQMRSASERLEASYKNIEVSDFLEIGGSAMVVDEELQVIPLGGTPILEQNSLSKAQWTQFLCSSGEASKYKYDVAYNEGENSYWLVLRKPQAVSFSISLFFNPDAYEYKSTVLMFNILLSSYLIALTIFIVIYSKRVTKGMVSSIESISEGTKKLEKGQYEEVGDIECPTQELDNLNRAFIHLSEKLQTKEEIQREEEEKRMLLVSELSHDLKTPLASVQGYSEMLLSGTVGEGKKQEYLQMIYDNSIRSNHILQALFTFSKLGSAGYKPSLEKTDICEFTRRVIAEHIPQLEEKGFAYALSIPESDICVKLNVELFRRVYDNLIENSIKYNNPGTKIEISIRLRDERKMVEIVVDDDGVGIDEEHIAHIFEPFYKIEKYSANIKVEGSGLGLAIVNRIVILHGGQITYCKENKMGCRYQIELPIDSE